MLEINLHLLEGTLAVYSVVGVFLYFLSVTKKIQYTQFITRNKFLKIWIGCISLEIMKVVCAIGIEFITSNANMRGELYTILAMSFIFEIAAKVLFLIIIFKRAVGFTYRKPLLIFFCIFLFLNEILNIIPFLFVVVFSILWLLIPTNIPEELRCESI